VKRRYKHHVKHRCKHHVKRRCKHHVALVFAIALQVSTGCVVVQANTSVATDHKLPQLLLLV
jgi:hypothetical protein